MCELIPQIYHNFIHSKLMDFKHFIHINVFKIDTLRF